MPQLLLLAVGRQVIVDKDNGLVSLVSIFSGFTSQEQKDIADSNAVAPLDWGCAAIFKRTAEDEGMVYELQFRLVEPDGHINFEAAEPFVMNTLTQSMVIRGGSFPASQEGTYAMMASIREYESETDWQEVGRFPIDVAYSSPKEDEEAE